MNPGGSNYPMASLYVGDLHPDVTEAMLYEKFSSAGHILSLRVCRDKITKRSLGYAYINFQDPADAERALDLMNFDLLKGKPIRIMRFERNPALRKSGAGNVFIKNLDKSIDNKALYDTFSTFGSILSCKIAVDETGASKGYGYVHFETEDAANKCIEKVNGMLLNGKKVFLGKFIFRNEKKEEPGENAKKSTNVYVNNFGDDFTDDQLKEMFEKFGPITSHKVMTNDDGKSKGFGFVAFEDSEAAEKAIASLNGKEIVEGKPLFVGQAKTKAERQQELKGKFEELKTHPNNIPQGVNLYVKNIDDNINDEGLRKEFEPFGTITSAKVMMENGRSKGFGFVCYSSPEEATKAVTEMNGRIVGSKPLYVALAQRKEERKTFLASQYMKFVADIRMKQIGQPIFHPSHFPQPQRFFGPVLMPPNHLFGATTTVTTGWPTHPQSTLGMQQPQTAYPTIPPYPFGPGPRPLVDQPPQKAVYVQGQEPLTTTMLVNAPFQDQKQMLGERLYPLIQAIYSKQVAQITGMLLEMDNSELLQMLEDEGSLKCRVEEAAAVLQDYKAKTAAAENKK